MPKNRRHFYFIAYAFFYLRRETCTSVVLHIDFIYYFARSILSLLQFAWFPFAVQTSRLGGNYRWLTDKETWIFESAEMKLYWIINLPLCTYFVISDWIWCTFVVIVGDQYQCCLLKSSQRQFKFWLKPGTLQLCHQEIYLRSLLQPEFKQSCYVDQSVFPQLLGEWQTYRDQNLIKAHH